MTWYYDPDGSVMDVFDHTGTKVASAREFGGVDAVSEVKVVMRENLEGSNQPTAYNQNLIVDAATGNIEEGTPP